MGRRGKPLLEVDDAMDVQWRNVLPGLADELGEPLKHPVPGIHQQRQGKQKTRLRDPSGTPRRISSKFGALQEVR